MTRKLIRRLMLSAAVGAGALGLAAGSAWACNLPNPGPDGGTPATPGSGPSGWAPGDEIGFVIGDMDEGASWSIAIEGKAVANGVDDDGRAGYRGRFKLPDLGTAARELDVDVTVSHFTSAQEHDNGTWPSSFKIRYRGSNAADSPAAAEPVPEPAVQAPQVSPDTRSTPSHAPEGSPSGTGGTPPARERGVSPLPNGSGAPSSPAGSTQTAGRRSVGSATAPVRSRAGGGAEVASRQPAVVPDRVLEAATSAAPANRSARPAPGASLSPWLLAALVLLAGAGGAGALVIRRRRSPSPGPALVAQVKDAEIEAELQEMIAEQRLRSVDEAPKEMSRPAAPGGSG